MKSRSLTCHNGDRFVLIGIFLSRWNTSECAPESALPDTMPNHCVAVWLPRGFRRDGPIKVMALRPSHRSDILGLMTTPTRPTGSRRLFAYRRMLPRILPHRQSRARMGRMLLDSENAEFLLRLPKVAVNGRS